ncbi:hypothetical protein FIU85_03365 [Roseovarius sp. THAF8]|uniref:hypothetical protein n=1 Tax=Roseovarius sp. THAF8 TaxID=2587846 RepID=UPI001268AE35|nr:hypothetical protein [Roseovarius sp. THAF8]QFT96331.1 hypothetical protein FIU85_03365 [Roseovarius sp. THAF8]
MAQSDTRVMAGLIFMEEKSIDLLDAVTRTAEALKGLCEDVRSLGFLSDRDAGVETEQYRVCLTLSDNVVLPGLEEEANTLLRIDVCRRDPAAPDSGPAIDAVLARVAIDLSDHLRPKHLQWVEQEAILSTEEVFEAREPAACDTPEADTLRDQTLRARSALTGIGELHSRLDEQLERTPPPEMPVLPWKDFLGESEGIIEDTPQMVVPAIENIAEETDRLRLSAWLLSLAVACIALPVGVALVIINLVKGENLRLAGQAAALSGLFVSLQANGATAAAAQVIQSVLG